MWLVPRLLLLLTLFPQVSERETSPQDLSFGWARAQLLGAFFNGAFLLALGLSITVQSIERFIKLEPVTSPKVVLIVGCVGLTLNIISAAFLHGTVPLLPINHTTQSNLPI